MSVLRMKQTNWCSQAQGPSWAVLLGRRDGTTANRTGADISLPSAVDTLDTLKEVFLAVGLNTTDLVSLSGSMSILITSVQK